jgi:hypothetical protein
MCPRQFDCHTSFDRPLPLSMPGMPNVPGYQACRSCDSFHPSSATLSPSLSRSMSFCLSFTSLTSPSLSYSLFLTLSMSDCLSLSLTSLASLSLYLPSTTLSLSLLSKNLTPFFLGEVSTQGAVSCQCLCHLSSRKMNCRLTSIK